MANRQHGRSRNPAGGRSPAGGRTARAVPVSRFTAEGRDLSGGAWTASRPQPGTPSYTEPEVRRWPHPLEDAATAAAPAPEPALHYIRCALSYQNQILEDIKALLERLAEPSSPAKESEMAEESQSKL